MDSSEKLILVLSLLLLAVFFSAVIYASSVKGVKVPTCLTDVEPFASDTLFQTGPNEYELHSIARMWAFQPSTVEIPVGTELNIFLTSQDVVHGFHIEDKNVNLMAVPGAVNNIKVTFSEAGTYQVVCHEYCGAAHHVMAGKIEVK